MKKGKKPVRRWVAMLTAAVLIFCQCGMGPAYAADYDSTYYTKQENRVEQNRKMIEELAEMDPAMFTDKYLGDLIETKRTAVTKTQQQNLAKLAEQILEDGNPSGKSLTDLDKLSLFHDWITEHFYYYSGDGVQQNPVQLYQQYQESGRVRTWCNGYSAMLIAFARSQGIPSVTVHGHYIRTMSAQSDAQADASWQQENAVRPTTDMTHWWTAAYVEKDGQKQWVIIDCNADCYNSYKNGAWTSSQASTKKQFGRVLFAPSMEVLSRSHIIWDICSGSYDLKYFSNAKEKQQLKKFLNYKSSGKTNGKRINSSYSSAKVTTWFAKGTRSCGSGDGRLLMLYFPENKGIAGKLELNGFTSLRNFQISNNKITKLSLTAASSLSTAAASNCRITDALLTGCADLKLLNLNGNPLTHAKYTFNGAKTAEITAGKGGTFQLRYEKSSTGKCTHVLTAVPKAGYRFKGWYNGSKLVSSSKTFTVKKTTSFKYTAKFSKV